MTKEIFKTVKGYEGLYEVSNLGNVKSLKWGKVRILKSNINSRGYKTLGLRKDGKYTSYSVHQLVAIAFLGHTPNGWQLVVDHIDNNKTNNELNNLQVISQRENAVKDRRKGTSKFTGVNWDKSANRWVSRIRIKDKRKCLGYFKCELKAAQAYNLALKKL